MGRAIAIARADAIAFAHPFSHGEPRSMLIDVTLPQLGESVNEGTISKWLVREGGVVKKDQALVSIATDKADSELPAPAAGRVTKILATEGQVVPVKTVIAQIEEGVSATLSAAPGPP